MLEDHAGGSGTSTSRILPIVAHFTCLCVLIDEKSISAGEAQALVLIAEHMAPSLAQYGKTLLAFPAETEETCDRKRWIREFSGAADEDLLMASLFREEGVTKMSLERAHHRLEKNWGDEPIANRFSRYLNSLLYQQKFRFRI